jgi:hypothetical protein
LVGFFETCAEAARSGFISVMGYSQALDVRDVDLEGRRTSGSVLEARSARAASANAPR